MAKISKIKAFKPRPIEKYIITGERLKKIIEKAEGLSLMIRARNKKEFIEFKNIIHERKVRAIFEVNCKDLIEAKQIVDIVRNM